MCLVFWDSNVFMSLSKYERERGDQVEEETVRKLVRQRACLLLQIQRHSSFVDLA